MKISVIYQDGSTGAVSNDDLDELLEEKTVSAFLRSDGWATVGVASVRDPFRAQGSSWRDRKALTRQRALVRSSNGECPESGRPFLPFGRVQRTG